MLCSLGGVCSPPSHVSAPTLQASFNNKVALETLIRDGTDRDNNEGQVITIELVKRRRETTMSDALCISKMHAADPYCRGKGVLDCGGIRGSEVKRSQLSSAMPIFRARPGWQQDCCLLPPRERSMNRTTWLQGPKFRDVLAAGNARRLSAMEPGEL